MQFKKKNICIMNTEAITTQEEAEDDSAVTLSPNQVELTPELKKKFGEYYRQLAKKGWNKRAIKRHFKKKFNLILL